MFQQDVIPISVATLMPSSAVGLDLYQAEQDTGTLVLYRGAEYPLAMNDLIRLQQRGVSRLFILKEAQGRYQKYLRQLASASTDDKRIPMVARLGAIDAVVRDVLSRSLDPQDAAKTVTAAGQLGKVGLGEVF